MSLLQEGSIRIERSVFPIQRIVTCRDEIGPEGELKNKGCGTSFFVMFPSGWSKEELKEALNTGYSDHRHHKPMATLDLTDFKFKKIDTDSKEYKPKRGRPYGSKNRPKLA